MNLAATLALSLLLPHPLPSLAQRPDRTESALDRTVVIAGMRESAGVGATGSFTTPGGNHVGLGASLASNTEGTLRASVSAAAVFDLARPPGIPDRSRFLGTTSLGHTASNLHRSASSVVTARADLHLNLGRWGVMSGGRLLAVTKNDSLGRGAGAHLAAWRLFDSGLEARARVGVTSFSSSLIDPVLDSLRVTGTRYHDLETTLVRHGRIPAELSIGGRLGVFDGLWFRGQVGIPIDDEITLEVTGGWQPGIPEQSIGPGRFLSVGIDLRVGTPLRSGLPPLFESESLECEVVVIRFNHPAASSVQMRGDVTDWAPIGLERNGPDHWILRRPRPPDGVYHISIRIDGSDWVPPPGLPVVDDGFGSRVGAWVVEGC